MSANKMVRVWLGLGSNIDAEKHIRSAVYALRTHYNGLVISPVYESESVGFEGDNFLNLVIGLETDETLEDLTLILKAIEDANGRSRVGEKFSSRTLDIDILTYGQEDLTEDGINIPRHEILTYAFVLKPLSDVAPDEVHPHVGINYQKLWDGFDQKSQPMQLYPMNFDS